MKPNTVINSISISKSENDISFLRYDIELSLDEIKNTDDETKLRYGITLLSNPKGTRLRVEGDVTVYGNQTVTSHYLSRDENGILHIVNYIYQEIFPLFYVLSKSMQIPCPAYKLSHISDVNHTTASPNEDKNKTADLVDIPSFVEEPDVSSVLQSHDELQLKLKHNPEKIIEESTIGSI